MLGGRARLRDLADRLFVEGGLDGRHSGRNWWRLLVRNESVEIG